MKKRVEMRGHRYAGGPIAIYNEERHWGIAGIAVTLIAAGVSAYAASEAASQQRSQANYNRKVAENQQAYALEQGRLEAESEADRQERLMSAQHVAYATSGVDTTQGTPLLVAMDSARRATKDLQLIRYGADVRGSGWSSEAMLQGILSKNYGKQRYTNAGVSLLGPLAQTAVAYGAPTRYGSTPATTPAPVSLGGGE